MMIKINTIWSLCKPFSKSLMKNAKIVGEILSPCWTPDETGNQLVSIPFNSIYDVVSKNMALMEL